MAVERIGDIKFRIDDGLKRALEAAEKWLEMLSMVGDLLQLQGAQEAVRGQYSTPFELETGDRELGNSFLLRYASSGWIVEKLQR